MRLEAEIAELVMQLREIPETRYRVDLSINELRTRLTVSRPGIAEYWCFSDYIKLFKRIQPDEEDDVFVRHVFKDDRPLSEAPEFLRRIIREEAAEHGTA